MNSFEVIKERCADKRSPLFSLSEIAFVMAREYLMNRKAISFLTKIYTDEFGNETPNNTAFSGCYRMPIGGEKTVALAEDILDVFHVIVRDQNEIALNSLLRYFVPELFRLMRNNQKTIDEEFVFRFLTREKEDKNFFNLDSYSTWREETWSVAIYLYVLFCADDKLFYRTEQSLLRLVKQSLSGYPSIPTNFRPNMLLNGQYDPAGIHNTSFPLNLLIFSDQTRERDMPGEQFILEAVSGIHDPGVPFMNAPNQFDDDMAFSFVNGMIKLVCKEVTEFCQKHTEENKEPSVGIGLDASVYQAFSVVLPFDYYGIDLRSLYMEYVSDFVKHEEATFHATLCKCLNSEYAWLFRAIRAVEKANGQAWNINPDNFLRDLVLGVQNRSKVFTIPNSGEFFSTILVRHLLSESVLAMAYRGVFEKLMEKTLYEKTDSEQLVAEKDQEIERLKKALEEQTKRAEKAEKALEEAERNRKQSEKQTEKEIYALKKENEDLKKKVEDWESAVAAEAEKEEEILPSTEGVDLTFLEGRRTDRPLLYAPDMPELFDGEIREHILKALSKEAGQTKTRHTDILKAVLAVNPGSMELSRRAEVVRTILTGYKHLSKADFAKLEAVGVTMIRQDGAHYILSLAGNEQYIVVASKTPSSPRTGANISAQIKATMF